MDQEKVNKRIRIPALKDKIMSAEAAQEFIKDGMVVAMSGFTRAGDPKVIPFAFADAAEKDGRKIYLMTGASMGDDVDGVMARAGAIYKRMPFMSDRDMRRSINEGQIQYFDQNLSDQGYQIRQKQLPAPDIAVIEALAVTEDGMIIPTSSFGNTAVFLEYAEKVILEVNLGMPDALEGVHDYYVPKRAPNAEPIPVMEASQRAGEIGVKIDPSKIIGIVLTDQLDSPSENKLSDPSQDAMATNLNKFFLSEYESGRLPISLGPLQAGVGSVANAALWGLMDSPFKDLIMFSEVLQDSTFDLLDCGKMIFAAGTAITISPGMTEKVYGNFDRYKDKIVLRPTEVSNNAELIKRINLIAVNTAMDVDIYGNVNSTHIGGTHIMNGIGGSGDFATNAHTTIFLTRAAQVGEQVSRVLPMVPHVDHHEHNVDVIITDQGIADIRGLSPRERAQVIINNCAHPVFVPELKKYVEEANKRGGQTPHVIEKSFEWFARQRETGSMLP